MLAKSIEQSAVRIKSNHFNVNVILLAKKSALGSQALKGLKNCYSQSLATTALFCTECKKVTHAYKDAV